jgi:hypothetical protein
MKLKMVVVLFGLLACASVGYADITGWNCGPDGDGVITLRDITNPIQWTDWGDLYPDDPEMQGLYDLTMYANHNPLEGNSWVAGHMVGDFTTDGDPNIKVTNNIENDTEETWTDYHINIYMDHSFQIVPLSSFDNIPGDWTSVITAVTGSGSSYVGSIDYYAGTAVAPSDILELGYRISWTGSGIVNFTQEMIPTPEPGTFVLLACGLMGLLVIRRRFS